MKLSKVKDLLLKNSSAISVKEAERVLVNLKSKDMKVTKTNDSYNIYATFNSKNKLENYNTKLIINLKEERISKASCNCELYRQGISGNRNYICYHILASGFKFMDNIKDQSKKNNLNKDLNNNIINKLKKITELSQINIENLKKQQLKINLFMNQVDKNGENFFDINIFIGKDTMYPIVDIESFLDNFIKKKEYIIAKGFVYREDDFYIHDNDKKILDFIYGYILTNKKNVNNNVVRIHSYVLGKFLKYMNGKKIQLRYMYQNNIVEVKKEDIPLKFTLKCSDNLYLLSTRKILPVPLNKKMDVFLYEKTIYMPSAKQIKIYEIFYREFIKNCKLKFDKKISNNEFSLLVNSLKDVANDISFDDEIIDRIIDNIGVQLSFYRNSEEFFCDISIKIPEGIFSYNEAIDINDDKILPKKLLKNIELELNRKRFYYYRDTFKFMGDDDELYQFLSFGYQEISKIGKIKSSKESSLLKLKFEKFEILSSDNEKLYCKLGLEGIKKSELKSIVKAYDKRESYIKLEDGRMIDLTSKQVEDIMQIIKNIKIHSDDRYEIELRKLFYLKDKLDSSNINKEYKFYLDEIVYDICENDKKFKIPNEFNGVLREYQITGYNWLKNLKRLNLGGILSDDMGLGKTIQILSFLISEHKNKKNEKTLIVTPTSLIFNWKNEFKRFVPTLKVGIISGNKKARIEILKSFNKYDVFITSYSSIRNDFEEYDNLFFNNFILDEGQNINNHVTQISKIVKSINSGSRFVLTGTPIENNLNELWSIFDFILPGYLYTNKEFKEKFLDSSIEGLKELKIFIRPYILRRLKKDVIKELPKKIEEIILIDNTKDQNNIYKGFVNEFKEKIRSNEIENRGVYLFSFLMKLRQICLEPSVVIENYTGGSGKMQYVENFIFNNYKEHKILVFSQFTSVLKKLGVILDQNNINSYYLDGRVDSKKRIDMVEEFNNTNEVSIFLISLKAGGTGLNLTSADTVIHFDPWWNPYVENQATDRAYRIGQKNDVRVLKLISRGTIEEKILLLQEEKKQLIDNVITDEFNKGKIVEFLKDEELLKLL